MFLTFSIVAVGIAADSDRTGVACAVFGDVSDGMELLVLLARSILATFLRRFVACFFLFVSFIQHSHGKQILDTAVAAAG